MIYGLYLSAHGADVQSFRQDVIANNLANASTTAFKRDLAIFQAHAPHDVDNGQFEIGLPGNLNESTGGLSLAEVATEFRDGSPLATGNSYDVAITGPGFLRVTNGREEFLTRNGQLTRNESGELVMQAGGHPVLGTGGTPIRVPAEAQSVEITRDGMVGFRDSTRTWVELGKLDVVQPESLTGLQKVGDSLYRTTRPIRPAGPDVAIRQGFLEASGTNPIAEMTEMIETSRAFEANVNMIKYQDEALGQLLQSVARR